MASIFSTEASVFFVGGTGTKAGDPAEFQGLKAVFGTPNGNKQSIAVGSVKSQIGHTKAAAGAAGLIKAAMALDQKVLPPTNNVTQPSSQLEIEDSHFYINTETRPWFPPGNGDTRKAAVSALQQSLHGAFSYDSTFFDFAAGTLRSCGGEIVLVV